MIFYMVLYGDSLYVPILVSFERVILGLLGMSRWTCLFISPERLQQWRDSLFRGQKFLFSTSRAFLKSSRAGKWTVFRPRAGKWTHFLPLNNKFLHFWSAIETLYYEEKIFSALKMTRKLGLYSFCHE